MTENNGFRDFESMTPQQRTAHYEAVCEAAGLDPALNLLKWTRMDSGDGSGAKRLVLYATKGATNAIREIQGIDVTGLTDKTVNNTFVVTASAKNKKGRTDFAMGAASLEGKRGKQLENAFALAQTRATRRVTLQMSGLDLLDESEVTPDGTTPIADAPLPLDQIGAPVEVNPEAGTDITPPPGLTLKTTGTAQTDTGAVQTVTAETRLPNPAAGLKLATTNISGPSGAARPVAQAAPIATHTEYHVERQADGNYHVPDHVGDTMKIVSNQTQATEAPKQRRKRRTKAEMEAARTQVDDAAPLQVDRAEIEQGIATNSVVDGFKADTLSQQLQAELEPLPAAKATPVKVNLSSETPTKEQMAGYVERLKKYREEILPGGGMVPFTGGLSINKKLRIFFSVANNKIEDLTKLTVAQWEATFAYMDEVVAKQGAKELVAIIEANIITTDEPTNQ